jgi:hypothetical protein
MMSNAIEITALDQELDQLNPDELVKHLDEYINQIQQTQEWRVSEQRLDNDVYEIFNKFLGGEN